MSDSATPVDIAELQSIEPCLSDAAVADILEGRAAPGVVAAAQIHAADCDACRELLANVGRVRAGARHAPTAQEPEGTLAEGEVDPIVDTSIGRFRILERIGQGGMGIVYAARDETLHRRVAIKVLRRAVPSDADGGRERLLREARAMASVVHPNVVTVHEVGVHDERVFIVMDLVDGTDLAVWCRREQRSFRETMRVWLEAGRGLAAVHAFGLVHRDFKPQNVLVAENGRVMVTDFGLVAATQRADDRPPPEQLQALVGEMQTETGVVLGTPRYMPPEQLAADKVDVTGDQFAYCLSLWEALTGVHPFGDDTPIDRLERVRQGIFSTGDRRVPSRVLAVLRRGLAFDPSARYPDMNALLRALQRARDAGRRRLELAGGAVVVAAAVTVGVLVGGHGDAVCDSPQGGDFAGIWDRERREELRASALAKDPKGEEARRLTDAIDAYTRRWSEMRREACEATRVREEVSEDMLDRRMACLARRRSAVASLVQIVRDGQFGPDASPLDLAYRLPTLGACDDLERLAAEPSRPTDPEVRQRIEQIEAELDAAEMLGNAGLLTESVTRIDGVIEQATDVGWQPLLAVALVSRAQLSGEMNSEAANRDWRRAYVAAIGAGAEVGFDAALTGARVLARSGELDEAEFLLDVAEAYADELGSEPRPGEVPTIRALLATQRGDVDEAEVLLREAIEAFGSDPQEADQLALTWGNLGGVLASAGRVDQALEATNHAIDLTADHFGEGHLYTLKWRANRAGIALIGHRYADAAAEAADVVEVVRGLDADLDLAAALLVLGQARAGQDRHDEGCPLIEEALTLRERALPEATLPVRNARYHLARCEIDRGRFAAAETPLRRALAAAPKADGDAMSVLDAMLAQVLVHTGRAGEALATVDRWADVALEPGYEHDVQRARAMALVALGDTDAAIEALQRAVAVQGEVQDVFSAAHARRELADLLVARGQVDAARAHVQAGLADLSGMGQRESATGRGLADWLARHDG